MFGLKTEELIIVLLLVLLFFGGKKVPELARSLGESVKEFRKALTDDIHATPPVAEKPPEAKSQDTHI